jgi:hypothetical protein
MAITPIAVADHHSIGAKIRERNSHRPLHQGNFTEIGQRTQKDHAMAFRSASKNGKPAAIEAIQSNWG